MKLLKLMAGWAVCAVLGHDYSIYSWSLERSRIVCRRCGLFLSVDRNKMGMPEIIAGSDESIIW